MMVNVDECGNDNDDGNDDGDDGGLPGFVAVSRERFNEIKNNTKMNRNNKLILYCLIIRLSI